LNTILGIDRCICQIAKDSVNPRSRKYQISQERVSYLDVSCFDDRRLNDSESFLIPPHPAQGLSLQPRSFNPKQSIIPSSCTGG
jgi:hypothetical protein